MDTWKRMIQSKLSQNNKTQEIEESHNRPLSESANKENNSSHIKVRKALQID